MDDILVLAIEMTRLEQYPGSAYANEYMYMYIVYQWQCVAIMQAISDDTVGTEIITMTRRVDHLSHDSRDWRQTRKLF